MISNGVDIVSINRFNNLSETFLNKNFTQNELDYIKSKASNRETIAGIYAAKEATLKAMGIQMNVIAMKDIEILHDNGRPFIKLHDEKKKDLNFSLSISHEQDYAIAFVIIY